MVVNIKHNMKQIIFLIFCSLIFAIDVAAQKPETFDIVSFQAPAGWQKKAAESNILFAKEDAAKGTYCLMTLYKSVPGTPDAKKNFDLTWTSVVKEMVTVSAAPEMQPEATKDGWEIHSGYAAFESDGNKGVVILVTASGFDKMVNLIILTNTDVYEKEMTTFLESISFKQIIPAIKTTTTNPAKTTNPAVTVSKDGFKFTATNFDDGWNAAEHADWVQVTKGGTAVLLHYGIQYTDETRNFDDNKRIEHYWNLLISPRYKVSNIDVAKTDYGKYDRVYFGEADGIEISTGNKAHIALMITSENGFANCVEVITPDQAALTQQFPNYDKIKEMNNYNKFAVSSKDLPGTWENSSAVYSQYYNTNTGNYAGMGGVSINAKFIFRSNSTFHFDYVGVSGMMGTPNVHTEKRDGKFTVNNWEMTITDKKGTPVGYSAQFAALRGGRVLHLQNKQFSGLKYQLYKQK